jgi:hypothetical protein
MSAVRSRRSDTPSSEQIARRRQQINSSWSYWERNQRARQANVAIKTLWARIARPTGDEQ